MVIKWHTFPMLTAVLSRGNNVIPCGSSWDTHVSILALLLYRISGPSFVSPSRVRLMHCTLRFSVIQKKSLSLDPQGALTVTLLQNRWQQPFIKANACFCLLTTAQSLLRLMHSHTHIYSYVCPHTYCVSHSYETCTANLKHTHSIFSVRRVRQVCVFMSVVSRHPQFLSPRLSHSAVPPEAASNASFSSPTVQFNSSTQKHP